MIKLIPDWKRARHYWSVRLAMLTAVLAGLESALPALREALPSRWYGVVAVLIVLARVLQQTPDDTRR